MFTGDGGMIDLVKIWKGFKAGACSTASHNAIGTVAADVLP